MHDDLSYLDISEADIPEDVARALHLQDEALTLLERLRAEEPFMDALGPHTGGGRRDFRRWPIPPGVTIELHDGVNWRKADCLDLGVGGARIQKLPVWVQGPVPCRLCAPGSTSAVIGLSDVMWRDKRENQAGLRFEFQDEDERDAWSGALIDALLAQHSLS